MFLQTILQSRACLDYHNTTTALPQYMRLLAHASGGATSRDKYSIKYRVSPGEWRRDKPRSATLQLASITANINGATLLKRHYGTRHVLLLVLPLLLLLLVLILVLILIIHTTTAQAPLVVRCLLAQWLGSSQHGRMPRRCPSPPPSSRQAPPSP